MREHPNLESVQRRVRSVGRVALLALCLTPLLGQSGGDTPLVVDPPESASLTTSEVYVSVQVLTGEDFEVWLTAEGQSAQDVTASFRFASTVSGTKELQHAHLAVPLGTHELYVVQYLPVGGPLESATRTFSRAEGAVRELGPIDDAGGAVTGGKLVGGLARSGGSSWVLFGETDLSASGQLPSAHAQSSDADPSDGIDLTYYNEPSAIAEVLGLATPGLGDPDEEEIWPSAPFERGSDVFAYYTRVDLDATPIAQGIGLAKATGAALPFSRLTFASGGHFDDAYSLFQGTEFSVVRAVVPSGSYVLVFGQREGTSGLAQDREIVLARAPLSSVETRSSYEFWTEVGGIRAWRTSATGIVPLFENASAPSVAWNAEASRWLAVATQEDGALPPYAATGARSALQVRVADDPRGPWSPPVTLWGLPPAHTGGGGTAGDALHLSGFDDGDFAYLAATDASDPALAPQAQLFELDLAAADLPEGPIAPQITTASGSTGANPTLVKGYASPGDTVVLVVNGTTLWTTTTAAADGLFQLEAALLDGANTVEAVASRSGLTSPPSGAITLTYTNAVDHNVNTSGKLNISTNTVWTAGTGSPYLVTGTLNIAPGVYLAIQRGAQLQFQTAASALLVRGELRILGTAAAPVKLGPNGVANPLTCSTPGGWAGLDVNNSAAGGTGVATIDHAQIGCAVNGIDVIGDVLTLRDSEIYNFQTNGVQITSGGTATLEGVLIHRATLGGNAGVQLSQAGAVTVTDCTVRRATHGIKMLQCSPTISGTLLELNQNGIHVARESYPEITGNVIQDNTTRGVWVEGNLTAADDPLPSLSGNDIEGNALDLVVEKFGDTLRVVEAFDNWWGSSAPATIATKISDASDLGGNNRPFAGFAPFLDASIAAGGESVPGNYLNGPATGALVPGEPYDAVGKVVVPAGALSTLLVQAGSEIRFQPGTALEAKGVLTVAGTPAAPVHLHSAKAVPYVGDWNGIKIEGAGAAGSVVEGALVEHAFKGVEIKTTWATVRDSTIRDFGRPSAVGAGVWIDGEGAPTDPKSIVRGNDLSRTLGTTETEYGIYVYGASPFLEDNEIYDTNEGLHLQGSPGVGSTAIAPTVTGNVVEENVTGARIEGHADPILSGNRFVDNTQNGVLVMGQFDATRDARPVANENEIYGNGSTDVATQSFGNASATVLDFERNWWGTTDLGVIAGNITDQSDSATAPVIDFAPPLDGAGGEPLAGQFLSGPTAPGATLTPGTYVVVGGLTVPVGETLVVAAGARLEFLPGAALRAKGVLDVQGGAANLATFTAAGATPSPGGWDGIVIEATGAGSSLDYARVEYATRGVDVRANGVSITNGEFGEVPVSGWGIYATAVTNGLVAGNLIDNGLSGDGTGIELFDATLAIDANTIQGFSTGIYLRDSTAAITQNLVQSNAANGIRLGSEASPSITNDNVVTANVIGILIQGNNVAAQNPNPTIQGNRILDNSSYELWTGSFGSSSTASVAATLNYWGSADSGTIGASIFDRTDAGSSNAPTVVFTPYLDANLQPVSGSYLNGTLGADLTLGTGTSWDVVGDLTVPVGRTLTVEPGVTLRFATSAALRVQGTLDVNGSASQKARFTSSQTSPTQSTWDGIRITAGSSTIDHARIEFADRAIDVRNAAADVRDSEIFDFGRAQVTVAYVGVYYEAATGTIEDNLIEQHGAYAGYPATGVHVYGAAPTLAGNTIRDAYDGVVVQGFGNGSMIAPEITGNTIRDHFRYGISVLANASPEISGGNVVTANQFGIFVAGNTNPAHDPAPVVNGNDLGGNSVADYAVGHFADPGGPALDAEENWWGTTSLQGIADRIADEGADRRPVDFAPFLDDSVGSSGAPVAGNYLVGPLSGGTLAAGTPYQVTGPLRVPEGQTVTLAAGSVFEFADGAAFEVDGTLHVAGTAADPVLLSSIAAAGPGDWKGVEVRSTSTDTSIAHARIEYAERGVDVRGTSVEISDSEIEFFEDFGLYLYQDASGTIDGNLIRNGSDLGTGIFIQESPPAPPPVVVLLITGNEIRDNEIGIRLLFSSAPTIEDGNTITSNLYGIRIEGGYPTLVAPKPNPAPIINGNSIFGNRPTGATVDVNLHVFDFWYPGTNERIDATGNWWGSTTAADIKATFRLFDVAGSLENKAVIDFSDFLDGVDGDPVGGARFTNTLANVRHSSQKFRPAFAETVAVDFDLLAAGSVDFIVYAEDDFTHSIPLYMDTLSFDPGPRTFTWDGRKDDGSFFDDGAYRYVLRVDGGVAGGYQPFVPNIPHIGSVLAGVQTPTFNAFKGEPWRRPVTVSGASRTLALRIQPEGKPSFLLFDQKCFAPSATPYDITWDGIDPDGQPVVGSVLLDIQDLNRNVTPNHLVLYAGGPTVTGPSVSAPSVDVRSSPSLVYHSYDQFTTITYTLDRQATVTVKLLPPGVIDPNAANAITLLASQSQASGEHTASWLGHDGTDTNEILAEAEGPYTFVIQATDTNTAKTSTTRGIVGLRR